MKTEKMKKILFAAAAFAAFLTSAWAQQAPRSSYFLDGYSYRHRLNPAFASSRSYFALPVMSSTDLSVQSNMGVSTFLYPYNGQLTTFMNGSVSADEFLGKLNRNNKINMDIATSLASVGSWGKSGKGFTMVDLNLKSSTNANLPYDLFDFMKNIGSKQQYDISNIGFRTRNYLELALGHSHKIGDRLTIGAKVKFLFGLAKADVNIDNAQVEMNADKWIVKANASLSTSIPGLTAPKNEDGSLDITGIGFDMESLLDNGIGSALGSFVGGYGGAIDLGAEFRFFDGLYVSASLLDLGFMTWNNRFSARSNDNYWEFDGFDEIDVTNSDGENSIGNQVQQIGDQFKDFIKMYEDENAAGKSTEFLSCTMNIGVEYEMPFYRRMSVGALSSTRFQGPYTWTEGRFSLNLAPVNWISLTANYGISTFGSTFGAMLNIHTAAFSLFVGSDTFLFNFSSPVEGVGIGIPINNLNMNLNFGLTFNVSKRRDLRD